MASGGAGGACAAGEAAACEEVAAAACGLAAAGACAVAAVAFSAVRPLVSWEAGGHGVSRIALHMCNRVACNAVRQLTSAGRICALQLRQQQQEEENCEPLHAPEELRQQSQRSPRRKPPGLPARV